MDAVVFSQDLSQEYCQMFVIFVHTFTDHWQLWQVVLEQGRAFVNRGVD